MIDEKTQLRTFVKNHRAEMIELETLLNSIPALSPENGGDGEYEKCEALESWLKKKGFTNLQRYDAPDNRVKCGVRPNLVLTVPGKDDNLSVWVMAHLDVVPPGDLALWNTDPWKVVEKDGKLYGRGVEDNQQGLVSAVFAALAFVSLGIKPSHTVKLLFIADEEVGSVYGIRYILKNTRLFRKQDVIIIPDGGDSKGETIEIAEKDVLWLKVHVIGKQTHGSRPDEGINACLAADDLALRLHDLESVFDKKDSLFEPPYSTFQPTMRLANGGSINIIPGEDTFCMDCRVLPCYKLPDVLKEVRLRCDAVEKQYNVKIEFTTPQSEESPATSADSTVVKKLSEAIRDVHGITARTIGIGGGTVGAYLRSDGFDAAVWSTLDERAHTPNEYCIIDNMIADSETLAVLMMNN